MVSKGVVVVDETVDPEANMRDALAAKLGERDVNVGSVLRHLAGMHDVSQTRLAEYAGSSKQIVGPVLTGRRSIGRDLGERLAGAFNVPYFTIMEGNVRLSLAFGLLAFQSAPIRTFTPEPNPKPEYRQERVAAAKRAAEASIQFHAEHPEIAREAHRLLETVSSAPALPVS